MPAKKIMIQGTMSNSGKSFVVAALCRIFRQDGYRVAPFKSQNMALNSYITKDGLEIGRAQAMQAEAAGIEPTVFMNPILLKPTSHMGSQVIVEGEVAGNWKAMDYYRRKPEFIPVIQKAMAHLEQNYDIVVLEGAGSPAEINLRDHDIVNMGMAKIAGSPVLLVGDIDRGGVFASLYGTIKLLCPEEQSMIKGLIINKFRGDKEILAPGLQMIEELVGIPVVGVIPMESIDLDDEDSLSERLTQTVASDETAIDIAVIHLPHISNFTDFRVLEQTMGVGIRYVKHVGQLGRPDLMILPGTKNTMEDLKWLRANGLEAGILELVEEKIPVVGICGGYQMLGDSLHDPDCAEGGGSMDGMGLLSIKTTFASQKTRTRITGRFCSPGPLFGGRISTDTVLHGYEIHMGATEPTGEANAAITLEDGRVDGMERADGLVFGTYLHGIFDNALFTDALLSELAKKKGITWEDRMQDWETYKEAQYDKLADLVRGSLDMEWIYGLLAQQD